MRYIVIDRVVWSVCHISEFCKNSWTGRDAILAQDSDGPANHVLDGTADSLRGMANFEGTKGSLIVNYRVSLLSSVQKMVEPVEKDCLLGCGLGLVTDMQHSWKVKIW